MTEDLKEKPKRTRPLWQYCLWGCGGCLGAVILLFVIGFFIDSLIRSNYPKYGLYNWEQVDVIPGQENQLQTDSKGVTDFFLSIKSVQQIGDCSQKNISDNPQNPYESKISGKDIEIVLKKVYTGGEPTIFDSAGLDSDCTIRDHREVVIKLPNLDQGKSVVTLKDGEKKAVLEASTDNNNIYLKVVDDPQNLIRIPFHTVKRLKRTVLLVSNHDFLDKSDSNKIARGISAISPLYLEYYRNQSPDAPTQGPAGWRNLVNNQDIRLPAHIKDSLEAQQQNDGTSQFDYDYDPDDRSLEEIMKEVQNRMANPSDIQFVDATEYFMDGTQNTLSGKNLN